MILYHGTATCFSRFRPYSFFTEEYGIAESFGRYRHGISFGSSRTAPRVIQVRVQLGRVLELNTHDIGRILDSDMLELDWKRVDECIFSLLRYHDADTARIYGLKDLGHNYPTEACAIYPQYVVRNPDMITFLNETVQEDYE